MTKIDFTLFAPYNRKANLLIDRHDWEPLAMHKGEDGVFRTDVELEDGRYAYKFAVQTKSWFFEEDEWREVVDPYATEVDPAEQVAILNVVGGKRIVGNYAWQHDEVPLPPDEALVIYELHIGDFSSDHPDEAVRGTFKGLTDNLDYLVDLGVNAIELMPVQEFPGDDSWGYNPRHLFAPESAYGSSQDLKELVDTCHSKGIRVIVDGIYNHAEAETPLTQIDHDYWFHHEPRDPDNNWGPEFNYEKYDESLGTYPARKFTGDNVRFWVSEYHLDGIRFDAARQIANYDFMRWIVSEAKEAAGPKPFYCIAEHIPETPEITGADGPMDGAWHESFYTVVNRALTGEEVDLAILQDVLDARRQDFAGVTNVVNYLSNHDHDHMMVALADADLFDVAAFKRVKLGAALLFTAFGIPMIWMGQEFGAYKTKSAEPTPLDWALFDNDENRELHAYYRGLIKLRREHPALHRENLDFFHLDPACKVLAFVRWNDDGARVVVVANLSERYLEGYRLPQFPEAGEWHEWTSDIAMTAGEDGLSLDLAEYEAKVLVR